MEYIHAALLLHSAGKEKIAEKDVLAVLKAAGIEGDEAKAKALVASLDGVNIDEAVEKAAAAPAAAPAPAAGAPAEGAEGEKKKEKKSEEEEKKSEEEAAAGLASLFG